MAKKNVSKSSMAKGLASEWKKIVWPTPKEILNYAIVVIIISAVVALLIFGLDTLFHFLYGLFIK